MALVGDRRQASAEERIDRIVSVALTRRGIADVTQALIRQEIMAEAVRSGLLTDTGRDLQDLIARAHSAGLRFIKSDDVNTGLATAQLALSALDEKIAGSGVYGETLTECIAARDELQAAICKAVEVG